MTHKYVYIIDFIDDNGGLFKMLCNDDREGYAAAQPIPYMQHLKSSWYDSIFKNIKTKVMIYEFSLDYNIL